MLDLGYNFCDQIAKLIPVQPGKTITLDNAREMEPLLAEREKKEDEVRELLELGEKLEGLTRNVGMHAGGVLIAPGKLTDFCPLYAAEGATHVISQLDKDDVEAVGLVKFDFLGLTTLTILDWAERFVRGLGEQAFSLEKIPLDDAPTYELLSTGNTTAVFQLESRGMRDMIRRARPDRFEDIIALVALYRPGPMDLIPDFCKRKHGERFDYPDPRTEGILSETYGIMVYQEQVMQMAQVVGGYSLGGADMLRRAMGKKKADEMAAHRELFRKGAAEKGLDQDKADEVFDLMEKFAGYGFNKSHAAAYSLLAYHTAWIKVHFPAEFFAANMTVELDNSDKLKALLVDARTFGVTIATPDINTGTYRFEPVSPTMVRYGLGAVKGTGQGAIEAIVGARREGGPFTSLFDFCARVDRGRINRRVIEALIKAGAFDALHPERSMLLASVGLALDWADTQAAHADQGGLFDFGADSDDMHGASTQEPALVPAAPWSIKERLTLEKAALGFYLSGHLFDQSAAEVRRFAKVRLADVIDKREPMLLAGIVSDLRVVNGLRGRVAIFKLDDGSEAMEAVANEELLTANRELLKDDELVIVQGKVQPDRFSGGVRLNVQSVWDLAAARCRFGKYLRVEVNGSVPPVAEVLREFPSRRLVTEHGEMPQGLAVRLALLREHATGEIDLGDSARFYPSEAALARWNAAAAHGRAVVVYE